jgi:hypothetical protein
MRGGSEADTELGCVERMSSLSREARQMNRNAWPSVSCMHPRTYWSTRLRETSVMATEGSRVGLLIVQCCLFVHYYSSYNDH